jgi:hypothetical protein
LSRPRTHPARQRLWPRHGVAALSVLLAALLFGPAFATTVVRMSLPRVVAASEIIVHGRVESVRSYWEGKRIWTEVGVAVARSLKGGRVTRVTFVQLGGRVESPVPVEMDVPGAPIHRAGDEAFFFLEPGPAGKKTIVGLFRGHVPVRQDERGPFVSLDGSRKTPEEFEEEIRRVLAGQETPRPRMNQ